MENVQGYALKVKTALPFEEAIARVSSHLKEEGFGILTEINVTATLKEKLNLDYKPYRILGACNPPFAHKALEAVNEVGVLLPCNVVVWDDGDHRVVAAMEPRIMAQVIDNPVMHQVADEVSARIHRALERVEQV